LDIFSLYKLYESRVKYVETAGKGAFLTIVVSTIVEQLLAILAILVGFQEALSYTGNKLSFMDWLLFSWCLASWIDQRPLLQQIFGSKLSTSHTASVSATAAMQTNASHGCASNGGKI
jgi:hypothetical protein